MLAVGPLGDFCLVFLISATHPTHSLRSHPNTFFKVLIKRKTAKCNNLLISQISILLNHPQYKVFSYIYRTVYLVVENASPKMDTLFCFPQSIFHHWIASSKGCPYPSSWPGGKGCKWPGRCVKQIFLKSQDSYFILLCTIVNAYRILCIFIWG